MPNVECVEDVSQANEHMQPTPVKEKKYSVRDTETGFPYTGYRGRILCVHGTHLHHCSHILGKLV